MVFSFLTHYWKENTFTWEIFYSDSEKQLSLKRMFSLKILVVGAADINWSRDSMLRAAQHIIMLHKC